MLFDRFDKSREELKKLTPFEQALTMSKTDDHKIANYYKYLDYIKNNPTGLNILYERAVADVPLNPDLWRRYCLHAWKLGPKTFALNVCERALRNCTWNANIWTILLQTLEYYEEDHKKVRKFVRLDLQTYQAMFYFRSLKNLKMVWLHVQVMVTRNVQYGLLI